MTYLSRSWLGTRELVNSPAAVMEHLHYDLFSTRGRAPTFREEFRRWLRKEGSPELLRLTSAIIEGLAVAALIYYL